MGRKTTKEATIKIRTNPVRGRRGNVQCAEELQQFFVCMTKSGGSNINTVCSKEIQALRSCAAAAARAPKAVNTINYHLQRIARMMKR
eukprot:jgi/Picsp_1/341/NSC_00340-R1_mitochondrial ribosomal protein subunit mrp10